MDARFKQLMAGLCLLAGLGTSGLAGAADGFSQDPAYYESKRAQIRQACEEFEAQGTEPYQKIYDMLPDRFEEYVIIITGSEKAKIFDIEVSNGVVVESWKWLKTDEQGIRCDKLLDKAQQKVSPEYILLRIKRLIVNNTFNLKAVFPFSRANSLVKWPVYRHLFDENLQPVPPGAQISYLDDEVLRREQFSRLIEKEDDLTIKKFILFATYESNGTPTLGDYWDKDLSRGWGIRFAPKALIKESPHWYKAYNDLVPMLCGRLNNWVPTDQKVCLTRNGKRP